MRKGIGIFIVLFALFSSPIGAIVKELPSELWEEELENIEMAIERLTDLRNKELAKATRRQNDGDRLQFQPHNLLDAKQAWADSDASREIAGRYQEEIDMLEMRKQKLLEMHGKKSSSSCLVPKKL